MEAYTGFAEVYDLFMDNIPYEEWGEYVKGLLKEYGVDEGLVLELGCGTGTMTEILASAGYDMIGIDQSEEMLEEALEKKQESGHEILYLCQDMREFELYGTVRAIICICDSMNYILEEEEVLIRSLTVRKHKSADAVKHRIQARPILVHLQVLHPQENLPPLPAVP